MRGEQGVLGNGQGRAGSRHGRKAFELEAWGAQVEVLGLGHAGGVGASRGAWA